MNRRWLQSGLWFTAAALNAATVAWLAWALAAPILITPTSDAVEPPPMTVAASSSNGMIPELAAYGPVWGEPSEFSSQTDGQPLDDGALQLMATVLEAGHTYAVFLNTADGRMMVCREGQTINDMTVLRIEAGRVHLQRDGEAFVLQLPEDAQEEGE